MVVIFPDAVMVVSISDIDPQSIKKKIKKAKEYTEYFTDLGTAFDFILSMSSSNSSNNSFINSELTFFFFSSSDNSALPVSSSFSLASESELNASTDNFSLAFLA